jgi:mono/diheme cytochrome c family protein
MDLREKISLLSEESSLIWVKPPAHGYAIKARQRVEEDGLQLFRLFLLLPAIFVATQTLAADAANGKRLAEMRCVTCHVVAGARRDVTDAPPFDVIARKFELQPQMLAFSMLDPHPRMNVAMTRREAEDIAAYINTLAR